MLLGFHGGDILLSYTMATQVDPVGVRQICTWNENQNMPTKYE